MARNTRNSYSNNNNNNNNTTPTRKQPSRGTQKTTTQGESSSINFKNIFWTAVKSPWMHVPALGAGVTTGLGGTEAATAMLTQLGANLPALINALPTVAGPYVTMALPVLQAMMVGAAVYATGLAVMKVAEYGWNAGNAGWEKIQSFRAERAAAAENKADTTEKTDKQVSKELTEEAKATVKGKKGAKAQPKPAAEKAEADVADAAVAAGGWKATLANAGQKFAGFMPSWNSMKAAPAGVDVKVELKDEEKSSSKSSVTSEESSEVVVKLAPTRRGHSKAP